MDLSPEIVLVVLAVKYMEVHSAKPKLIKWHALFEIYDWAGLLKKNYRKTHLSTNTIYVVLSN